MQDKNKSICTKGTRLEKVLVVIVGLLICFVLALFVILVLQYGRLFTVETTKTCTKHECIKAAAQILDSIDTQINPCDDFYKFVCGSFLKESLKIHLRSPVVRLQERANREVNCIISAPSNDQLPKAVQSLKTFYKTCRNISAIDEDNNDAFFNLIEKLGGWPVLKGRFWYEPKFNWINFMIQARQLGIPYEYFLSFSMAQDKSDRLRLYVTPLLIGQHFPINRDSYLELMTDIAVLFQAPVDQATNELDKVLQFTEQLVHIANDSIEKDNATLMKIGEIQQKFPDIPWIDLLNNVTGNPRQFNNESLIMFKAEKFLENFLSLLKRFPKRTHANYLFWRIILDYSEYLKKEVRGRFLEYHRAEFASHPKSRTLFCLDETKFYFPGVAEIAYIREHLGKNERADIREIVSRVQEQIMSQIESTSWFDEETKIFARKYVNKTKAVIGHNDEFFEDDFDKVVNMEKFEFHDDNIINMIMQLNLQLENYRFKYLNRHEKEVNEFHKTLMVVNAYYLPPVNTLTLAAPLLQGMQYNLEYPKYINYGALGTVIGHEITHAATIDEKNEEGVTRIAKWWSNSTSQKFQAKSKCLVDLYDSYDQHIKGFPRNGTDVLNENMADFNGLNVAYKAYQKWVKSHGEEEKLPGLDYTPNQIFWMMVGVNRCYQADLQEDEPKADKTHGVHSFIVNVGLQNSPHFAKDFNCPSNSKMNPPEKCVIFPV